LKYNLKLSQQRANAAVEYIVKKGIPKERISGKGYGESKLINKCADGVDCSEEEHSKNRRTEFNVSYQQK
jgi:outer membrane protein OmpA-like peptidoglycan-associated protein